MEKGDPHGFPRGRLGRFRDRNQLKIPLFRRIPVWSVFEKTSYSLHILRKAFFKHALAEQGAEMDKGLTETGNQQFHSNGIADLAGFNLLVHGSTGLYAGL